MYYRYIVFKRSEINSYNNYDNMKYFRLIGVISIKFLLHHFLHLNSPFRTSAVITSSLHPCHWYSVCKDVFWSKMSESLVTTSSHRVFGRPEGLVLFILLTSTLLIIWSSALHTCPNHSSHLLIIKKCMSGLLYSDFIFSLLLLSCVCVPD